MDTSLPQPPPEASDIFSLSDQVLSDRLRFVEEIGFGNWGSVWLCRPKTNPSSSSADSFTKRQDMKVAVKLVHRSKTEASIARVRSLWNEMKIVRSFKNDPHPSIIPFHSFIITPSYALITMSYLPTLIPVEVEESRAKWWFSSLLSGVDFLHKRGVVHNDIKPANILLSDERVPVFVDFGFAEKYDVSSPKAFHSNLKYGTPEYLSPERARGLPHDTRKSDIWSLGVTFFEILIGRTPFEYVDGEEFCTEEDMERYWGRTLRGKWVGEWRMSKGMEKMLQRMIAPNADLRCNAVDVLGDSYWNEHVKSIAVSHQRSASASHAPSPPIILDKEVSKLMDISFPLSPFSTTSSSKSRKDKENVTPQPKENKEPKIIFSSVSHSRSNSQPKVVAPKPVTQARKRPANLSPVKASPPNSPISSTLARGNTKENIRPRVNVVSLNSVTARQPFGARQPFSAVSQNLPLAPKETPPRNRKVTEKARENASKRNSVLKDLTGLHDRNIGQPVMVVKPKAKARQDSDLSMGGKDDSVRKRVKEWEREKERLREMERLEAFEKERDHEIQQAKMADESTLDISFCSSSSLALAPEKSIQVAQVAVRASAQVMTTAPSFLDISNIPSENLPTSPNGTGFTVFKHGLKMSIDKGVRICKSSVGQITGRDTPGRSLSVEEPEWRIQVSDQEPWESEALSYGGKSSVVDSSPTVPTSSENERLDRMNLWMRDVEQVIEDARQTFASASTVNVSPLPVPPSRSSSQNRTTRSSRLPRKILAASQIFSTDASNDLSTSISAFINVDSSAFDKTLPTIQSDVASDILAASTPPRKRRATITTRSPELKTEKSFDIDASPSKRREKARSQGNLLRPIQRPIQTIERLELELRKDALPPTTPRLSAFLEPNMFIASPKSSGDERSNMVDSSFLRSTKSLDINHLTSSPVHIEPYPPRKSMGVSPPVLDTPNRRRVENVYDRFLMATAGVKRVGRGYQSDNVGPVQTASQSTSSSYKRNDYNQGAFNSARRAMPPPVSSEDLKVPGAVDEFGLIACRSTAEPPHHKDEGNNTVAFVRRAFKAVAGKTVSRRLSRAVGP